mmetsp:Transcript_131486/g.366457  ORF Transcript_131486/g.366457 Transcript_131486/m.366457 type:complete len:551 (+) Transcript_131486:95-1747(+)
MGNATSAEPSSNSPSPKCRMSSQSSLSSASSSPRGAMQTQWGSSGAPFSAKRRQISRWAGNWQQGSFADDAALDVPVPVAQPEEEAPPCCGPLTLSARLEYASLHKGQDYNVFGVVSLTAADSPEEPGSLGPASNDRQRSPMDITCVLDVSGSMQGEKVQLVKDAMFTVVDEMQPGDRLSIVSFNHDAQRHTRVARMTAEGKDEARQAVLRLQASGGTSIAAGLDCAIANMEQRRQRNPVGAIFLLTDGQDPGSRGCVPQLVDRARAAQCAVYAFGFGADHDTSVLSAISEMAQTPFTFVERLDAIKEAFAGAVGGPMSVAAQSIELRLVPESGCALSAVRTHFPQRREAGEGGMVVVSIPDAFAGERRDVLVELRVPAVPDASDGRAPLLHASAKYLAVKQRVVAQTPAVQLEAERSGEPEGEPDVEVTAQRQRVEVTDALERAIAHGQGGRLGEAEAELARQEEALCGSRAKTAVSQALLEEVRDARRRVSSAVDWRQGGHAEMADAMWMHRTQRCTNATAVKGGSKKSSKSLYIGRSQASCIERSGR